MKIDLKSEKGHYSFRNSVQYLASASPKSTAALVLIFVSPPTFGFVLGTSQTCKLSTSSQNQGDSYKVNNKQNLHQTLAFSNIFLSSEVQSPSVLICTLTQSSSGAEVIENGCL